jgi:hypothetical protein
MKGDISPSDLKIAPHVSKFSEVQSEMSMPKGSFSIASSVINRVFVAVFLSECPFREDFYRTNVVIQENAT